MKSLFALSAAVLLSSALAHGTAQACSPIYVPNGLGRLELVGADALPLDSGIVLTAAYRKVGDGDVLDALKVEVTAGDEAVPGKATIVSRAPFATGAENLVVRWVPDVPFTAGEDVRVKVSVVTQPQPSEPVTPIDHTFRVTETKLADLVAPTVVIAGHVAREITDASTPRATCTIAEAQPGMCGPGMAKGSELSFPSQLRNVAHFLVDVKRDTPRALEPFVRYATGDSPLYSSGRQEMSAGTTPAGSEHCIEVTASTIVGDVVRSAKACAIVPDTPPVSDAKQKEYIANATRLCATGSITPEAVAEEAEAAKGNGTSSTSSAGCNASGHESPAPVAAIAAVAALVALRRRAKKARSSAT